MNMKNQKLNITIAIISTIVVALLGSLFVQLGNEWFENLTKPSEWIPSFVIPIVWTIIYLLAIIVLVLWIKKGSINKNVVWLFIINGVLNILWCLIFFTLNQLFLGLITIILNLLFSVKLLVAMFNDNNKFGWLLSIYPLWLMIASTLNIAVWILN